MLKLLKKALSWLANPWVQRVLLILFICLIIYFIGPGIKIFGFAPLESRTALFAAIAAAIFVWGVVNLILVQRQAKKNAQFIEAVTQSEADEAPVPGAAHDGAEADIAAMRARFDSALKLLKSKRLGKERDKLLYQLPWYVVIGPPGGGKTTLLRNSGLDFPLSDEMGDPAVQGLGGTRNCDWWFAEDAVLLDTAGRYTTQDSDAERDRNAWNGFLDLLKKYRAKRPVDGIIVALSLDELLAEDGARMQAHAKTVRDRIEELQAKFQLRVPVYLTFTKTDLAAGFTEFFDDLDAGARAQVLGLTLPLEASLHGAFERELPGRLDALFNRLRARMTARLEEEQTAAQRARIFALPRQLEKTRAAIIDFVREAFAPTRFSEPIQFRGVYFTSATQEGAPIDRLIGDLARSFDVAWQPQAAAPLTPKAFFIRDLLNDLVFREVDLVDRRSFLTRNRTWIERGAYGGIAALTVLLMAAWITSFFGARQQVNAAEREVAAAEEATTRYAATRADIPQALALLDTYRSLPNGYGDRGTRGVLAGFGLSQQGKIGRQSENAYGEALNTVLVPIVMERLEAQIRGAFADADVLYESLRTYLMFNKPSRRVPEEAQGWILSDWQRGNGPVLTDGQMQAFQGHLTALFDLGVDTRPVDGDLVREARLELGRNSLSQRIYNRIRRQELETAGDWRPGEAVGEEVLNLFRFPGGRQVTGGGIPAFFTRDYYLGPFQEQVLAEDVPRYASERWVVALGDEQDTDPTQGELQDLKDQVLRLYLADYEARWRSYLDGIALVRPGSLIEAANTAARLAEPSSPGVRLLAQLTVQTTLSDLEEGMLSGLGSAALRQLNKVKGANRFRGLLGDDAGAAAGADPEADLERAFQPLRALFEGEEGARPIDRVLPLFNQAADYLRSADIARRQGQPAGDLGGDDVIERLRLEAARQPEPLRSWLESFTGAGDSLVKIAVLGQARSAFGADVARFCRSALAGRYPFTAGSSDDVNINDFAQLFAPGGLIESFFNEHLAPHIDRTSAPWAAREAVQGEITPETIAFFERASKITDAFFPFGAASPNVTLRLIPQNLDAAARRVILDFEGQTVPYEHGPVRSHEVKWPVPNGTGRASAEFAALNASASPAISAAGQWALFRLIDQGQVSDRKSDRFDVTFDVQGLEARFTVETGSVASMIDPTALRQFSCIPDL